MRQSRLFIVALTAVLAALILTVAGCTVGSATEYKDSSQPIKVEKGSSFTIVLDSNPTTGYQWQFTQAVDEKVITLTKTEYVKADPSVIGSGGQEKWTFKAEEIGETTISLQYVRPWETPNAQQQPAGGQEGNQNGEQTAQQAPTTATFQVIVVAKGATSAKPKQYKDESQTIEAEKNVEFEIVLEANHTTGYQWQLAAPLDESILEVSNTTYAAASGEEVGAGGEETWTMDPVGVGSTQIKLELVRPWEKDVAPAEEKVFNVNVSEPGAGTSE